MPNVGTGDRGLTGLLSGERVPKTHPRVEACGDLDELVSALGALAAFLPGGEDALRASLRAVQADIMQISAFVSSTPGASARGRLPLPDRARVEWLERGVEEMDGSLPRLQSFILPGGHPAAAWAHVARSVCRRAERRVVALADDALAPAFPYLNRLSTWLFSVARWCNSRTGTAEIPWKG